MTKEEKIIKWIETVSKIRPELKGFAICPFAANSKRKIVACSIDNIEPIDGMIIV